MLLRLPSARPHPRFDRDNIHRVPVPRRAQVTVVIRRILEGPGISEAQPAKASTEGPGISEAQPAKASTLPALEGEVLPPEPKTRTSLCRE